MAGTGSGNFGAIRGRRLWVVVLVGGTGTVGLDSGMVVHRSVLLVLSCKEGLVTWVDELGRCGLEFEAVGFSGLLRRKGGTGLAISKSGRASSREDVSPS